jgi:hypothetical protein
MMRLASAAVVALCIAGAALAQEAPMMFIPEFEAEPAPADLVRHYPPRALQQNTSGIAILCCTPRADRSVSCEVSSEWPEGQGFGAASAAASVGYRLSELSHADLAARPETRVRISMLWAGPVILPATIDRLRSIDAETIEACLPPEQ